MKFTYPSWHRLYKLVDKTVLDSPSDKSGLPPGTLVHIGELHDTENRISVIQYSTDTLLQHEIATIADLSQLQNSNLITWINIDGLCDTGVVESIGQEFNIDPLILEDILCTHQRPKLEEYEDYLYLVFKGISVDTNNDFNLRYEQISMLLMEKYVITFKERADDIFKPIYHRLNISKGQMRQFGSDYLAYVILDTVVDEYFVVEDSLDEVVDSLEESLLDNPSNETLNSLQQLRSELISMKRSISPLRELLDKIHHSDIGLLKEQTLRFFNDVHDHVLRITDSIESYRERIIAMQDIYLTSISNKMNETMRVLTVLASIFIPLTFIVGIYGMNFENMPELKWRWAYPSMWLLFFTIGVGMLIYFKKKKIL